MTNYDVIIVGAGIAGTSMASEIAGQRSVLILEAEEHPGYHATGRSAAFWTETYGGPQIQPLTTASYEFLKNPDPDFSDQSFLTVRRAINIARANQHDLAGQFIQEFAQSGVNMERWDTKRLQSAIPDLKPGWEHAVYEPDCCDIDVAGLHAAYLKNAKRKGAVLQCKARVEDISRTNGIWNVTAGETAFSARYIINAAGAWADEIAVKANVKPIGIAPMRRTMVQLQTDPPSRPGMPLIVALDGSFYFKPEAGGSYWLSPHDETPVPAGDVAPEELDIALAIDRFQSVLDVEIKSVTRKWAGLRSFAPDRLPVYGFDSAEPGFFWFAGQGGFGIQTAPAAAKLAKALFLDQTPDMSLQYINGSLYDPARFRT